jgi:hypothetical protein
MASRRTDHSGQARIKIDRFVLIARRYFNGKDSLSGLKNILGRLATFGVTTYQSFPQIDDCNSGHRNGIL